MTRALPWHTTRIFPWPMTRANPGQSLATSSQPMPAPFLCPLPMTHTILHPMTDAFPTPIPSGTWRVPSLDETWSTSCAFPLPLNHAFPRPVTRAFSRPILHFILGLMGNTSRFPLSMTHAFPRPVTSAFSRPMARAVRHLLRLAAGPRPRSYADVAALSNEARHCHIRHGPAPLGHGRPLEPLGHGEGQLGPTALPTPPITRTRRPDSRAQPRQRRQLRVLLPHAGSGMGDWPAADHLGSGLDALSSRVK